MVNCHARIIWCCGWLFHTINFAQLLNDPIIKTFTLVTMYSGWDPISVKPLIHQGFGYCFCLLVGCNNCHTKFGECISHYQNIPFPIFTWVHLHEIYTQVDPWGLLAIIDPWWWIWINIRTLGSLTPLTFLNSICDILEQSAPIKSLILTVAYAPLPDDPVHYGAVPLPGP